MPETGSHESQAVRLFRMMTSCPPRASRRSAVFGFAIVAVGGLLVGVSTSYLQGVLPGASNTLANSGMV